MAIQHKDIADPNIHEPKGVAAASANTVYAANGSGSGTWRKITSDDINEASLIGVINTNIGDGDIPLTGKFYMTGVLTDVSEPSSRIIPIMHNCTVLGARFTLGGAITVADSIVQVKNSAGATMGSNVTIAYSASAKGTSFGFTASGNNVLTGPTWMEITTDGASSTTMPLYFTIEFQYAPNT